MPQSHYNKKKVSGNWGFFLFGEGNGVGDLDRPR